MNLLNKLVTVLVLFEIATAIEIQGFEFQDNEAFQHVTEDNGAAEVKIKDIFVCF